VTAPHPIGLFEAYGIELEYMIVDHASLDVRAIADRLLGPEGDVTEGPVTWSNELALHVIELKTTDPARTLSGLGALFQENVQEMNRRLAPHGARLLPTGMHPWMRPEREFKTWPHENGEVYAAFDRIFDARGHGWSNLQSVHLNLPFAGDEEFGKLHAAVRLVLPILPALAASSPAREGSLTGYADTRLQVYRHNADRVPSVVGRLVPERVYSRGEYEREVLERIYRDLEPLDREGILRHEWVNARGAIARFDRNTIEIRVLDVQECPGADLAVAGAVAGVVRALTTGELGRGHDQRMWSAEVLAVLFDRAVEVGDRAPIENRAYLNLFEYPGDSASARQLWGHLIERVVARDPAYPEWKPYLDAFRREGCLAGRIRNALGPDPQPSAFHQVYERLAQCLDGGTGFTNRETD
jgi:glutamate---cysteine ligase / carboxylate-amine ligase